MPSRISGAPPELYFALGRPFDANAYALAQGKRLYAWFGCPACHGEAAAAPPSSTAGGSTAPESSPSSLRSATAGPAGCPLSATG